MQNKNKVWNDLLISIKKEVCEKLVSRIVKTEYTQSRPGKDDYFYRYYNFHLKDNDEIVSILVNYNSGYTVFHCKPDCEISIETASEMFSYEDGHYWVNKIVETSNDYKLLQKVKHLFAFYKVHLDMQDKIESAKKIQITIQNHLTSGNTDRLEQYSKLSEICAGRTLKGSGYSGWDLFLKFDTVEYGSKDDLDMKNLDFNTYTNYENLIANIYEVERGFKSHQNFMSGMNCQRCYRLKKTK